MYYAHTRPGEPEEKWQLLKDHLTCTAAIAAQNGEDADISDLARATALLHDIGKYSDAFQARLRGSKRQVDHATAGAREIVELMRGTPLAEVADLISYCIAGHHSGLPDYGSPADTADDATLLARRGKKKLEEFGAYRCEIVFDPTSLKFRRIKAGRFRYNDPVKGERVKSYSAFSLAFLTRMLFSALVDADFLETERYMNVDPVMRGGHADIPTLKAEFDRYMERFGNPTLDIHRKRTETLRACVAKAGTEPGFFTLTVPTGGAKTLNSMAFALAHAVKHGLKRIIYVIPFTGIIEQNAAVFRKALGELGAANVLEHHSNFDWDHFSKYKNPAQADTNEENADDNVVDRLKRASENWDVPIVVTTNVQFFESLFASRTSAARKIHNLAKSVIIFDEVQTLPLEFLKPCLLAINELVLNYGSSVVLSTATQPSLQRFFPADTQFTELADDPDGLFAFYRRVKVRNLGTLTDEALLERLATHDQVLCIVNTRRHAKGLFDELRKVASEGTYHLSTLMCPAHRRATLETIKKRLVSGQPCRVISTQVMEAGIDVDFPVGYRALAGLDSIIQAAGRINREMGRGIVDMFVFRPETTLIKQTPTFIRQTAEVANSILRRFADDPTTIAAIEAYYSGLYDQKDEGDFDSRKILDYFEGRSSLTDFAFRSAAEAFNLIGENTVGVIIPFDTEARKQIAILERTDYPLSVLRRLQPYTVNIYEKEFAALFGMGAFNVIQERYYALREDHMGLYDPQSGLDVPERSGVAIFA